MPLIIITGLPCSGKTHRAQQIASSLNAFISSSADTSISKRTVLVVPSHHASSDPDTSEDASDYADSTSLKTEKCPDASSILRDEIYTSAALEKTARAAEFSAIKRALSRDTVVIADGLNYIKGYRYQLWCEAKTMGTRCCVVHVAAREDECKNWNRERLRDWGREEDEDAGEGAGESQQTTKSGENILGELMPESHTDIYGDRMGEHKNSRSRSSSMDGFDGTDSADDVSRSRHTDETMTLKSLYINPQAETTTTSGSMSPSKVATLLSTPHPQSNLISPVLLTPPPSTSSPPYASSTLTSLMMRYEPPSPFSRWDTPLFTVPSTDPSPPIEEIWNALYPLPAKSTSKKALSQLSANARTITANGTGSGSAPGEGSSTASAKDRQIKGLTPREEIVKPHVATVLPVATSSDALQTLESATMDVVKHLLIQSRVQLGGGSSVSLSIPLPPPLTEVVESTVHIPSSVTLSQPMLQRLRRKYTQIQRGMIAHGRGYVAGRRKVIEGFVEFLEREFDDDE